MKKWFIALSVMFLVIGGIAFASCGIGDNPGPIGQKCIYSQRA